MPETTNSSELLASLQARAQTLLDELKAFQSFLRSHNGQDNVEIQHFKNNVQSELKCLARVSLCGPIDNALASEDAEEKEAGRLHMLRSTNLPFYEAVWSAAKTCEDVTALSKRIHWTPKRDPASSSNTNTNADGHVKPASSSSDLPAQKKSVLIDVVAKGGLEWVKVSSVTVKRLLFEIAKEGWDRYSDSDMESSSEFTSEKPDLDLVRLAKDLRSASSLVRTRYQHPTVRLLLPKLEKGEQADVDAILEDLRTTGVKVECGGHRQELGCEPDPRPTTSFATFASMLPPSVQVLTEVLNIDCTLLLALISDISHVRSSALPDPPILRNNKQSYHSAIMRQITAEESLPLLPNQLYPLLIGRKLTCTKLAAKRACEIVDTMGTATERVRAELLFDRGDSSNISEGELRTVLQQNSDHNVPEDLQIRVTQVDFSLDTAFCTPDYDPSLTQYPVEVAKGVVELMNMSAINRSVFLYGWFEDILTITSNQAVVGRLEQTINHVLDDLEQASSSKDIEAMPKPFRGPRIWVCETARSLIGKHKSNEKRADS